MSEPIAFVARDPDDAPRWLAELSRAMPRERIVPFAEMAHEERSKARLAVVSDPDPADLAALPSLEWVHATWAGVERLLPNIPAPLAVTRLVDPQLAETMAEAVLTAVLWLHRDGPLYARRRAARVWRSERYVRPDERTIGVLGLGALGLRAAEVLRDRGFRTIGWSRREKAIDGVRCHHGDEGLHEVLGEADIAVLLLPLTDHTRHIIGRGALRHAKRGMAVVNFGRGALVDDDALLAALDAGHLSHAFLDVFATEPLPADHPYWSHERVTVWPHVSGPTDPRSASDMIAASVRRWRATGEVPDLVDRAQGY